MSRLYLTEAGHVVPSLCEELTRFRHARKILDLPPTSSTATLYLLARPRDAHTPLYVQVNGEVLCVTPRAVRRYTWYEIALEPSWLRPGANTFDLWTDTLAMDGWALALEAGHRDPRSFISDDGGRAWRNERMGYLNAVQGEYVLRVRLAEGDDPPPPPFVCEDTHSERLAALYDAIPERIRSLRRPIERVRGLATWLSTAWEHSSAEASLSYTPWDPFTILSWGRAGAGHQGLQPIVWCVHYSVAFVCCCQALSIPARCVAVLGTPSGEDGHFVAEVWLEQYAKWAMVDANLDAMAWSGELPLSVAEVQALGPALREALDYGRGLAFQRRNPRIEAFREEVFETGVCFRYRALWPRADFLSHPELSPPGHGALAYCEADLVWEESAREQGFGMFPYFADAAYFEAAPTPAAR